MAKKGCIPWNKGKKGSQVAWNKGLKGTTSKASIDNLLKIAKERIGKSRPPFSKEWKDNMSKASKGKKVSEETKKKMRLRTGEKGANWQGGLTKDKQHIKERKKNWAKKNENKLRDYKRNWVKKNYNKVLYSNLQRRKRKMNADGLHTLDEWENLKIQYNYICPACGKKEPKIKLTEDHIIPLSKGGSDNIENIQPLCRSCNSKKHTKIIKYGEFI